MKLTEDEVVIGLKQYLEQMGWYVGDNYRLGRNKGPDIKATKDGITLIVEAKGAKGNDNAPNKKRLRFDCGQVKDHLGKAIVTLLEVRHRHPAYRLAIAHPDDQQIRGYIGHLIPHINEMGIKHYWVNSDGHVSEN